MKPKKLYSFFNESYLHTPILLFAYFYNKLKIPREISPYKTKEIWENSTSIKAVFLALSHYFILIRAWAFRGIMALKKIWKLKFFLSKPIVRMLIQYTHKIFSKYCSGAFEKHIKTVLLPKSINQIYNRFGRNILNRTYNSECI